VQRYAREVTRLMGVLEGQLQRHGRHFILGDQFTVADVACWPWVYALFEVYDNAVDTLFGGFKDFPAVRAWYERCVSRPASKRALEVTPFVK